jgi:anti-sigma factor ChrR (cupin superfamily)
MLGWAARPQAPPATLRAAVLERIGAAMPDIIDAGGLRFVRGQHRPWEPTPIEGIEVRPLWQDAEQGRRTTVVRLAPGAEYPAHRHAGVEEIYLIEGDLVVSGVPMQAGDYCRAAAGTVHEGVRSPNGCLLLVSLSVHDEYL